MNTSEVLLGARSRAALRPGAFTGIAAVLGALYCRFFHGANSRPVNGKYRCWGCLREFELEG